MHYSRRFSGFNYAAANSGAKPAGSFASGDNLWYSWNAGVSHPDRPCVVLLRRVCLTQGVGCDAANS